MSEVKTLTPDQIAAILADHKLWLENKGGKRANLTSANLTSANLTSANLRSANLRYANLTYADLRSANLTSADLTSADLMSANLRYANLRYADLMSANLTYANLMSANLTYANLTSANLTSAKLRSANLRYANLRSANLTGETWEKYLSEILPQLLQSGGKTVEQIISAGAWECHTWNNCPMAEAFGIRSSNEAPALLRPRVEQFVQLFDAELIAVEKDESGKYAFKSATQPKEEKASS